MTNGEEMFKAEKLHVKRVPIQAKKRLVCCGLINVGRDENNFTLAERIADTVAQTVGSWTFVLTQVLLFVFLAAKIRRFTLIVRSPLPWWRGWSTTCSHQSNTIAIRLFCSICVSPSKRPTQVKSQFVCLAHRCLVCPTAPIIMMSPNPHSYGA